MADAVLEVTLKLTVLKQSQCEFVKAGKGMDATYAIGWLAAHTRRLRESLEAPWNPRVLIEERWVETGTT
jgi:hypothetical protein